MDINMAFARALRRIRKARNLTQEDFATVSSRTYVSTLERGLKSPTLEKMDELAEVLGVHPALLVILTYLEAARPGDPEQLLERLRDELGKLPVEPMGGVAHHSPQEVE